LLEESGRVWKREGIIQEVPEPKKVARTKFLETLAPEYKDERVLEDWKFNASKAGTDALLSKSASIYFASGKAELDANARKVVDAFADQLIDVFQNAYIRVEGNTDSTGNKKTNQD